MGPEARGCAPPHVQRRVRGLAFGQTPRLPIGKLGPSICSRRWLAHSPPTTPALCETLIYEFLTVDELCQFFPYVRYRR